MVAIIPTSSSSSIGYSFSPGGLLFPYHLGAISSLSEQHRLPPSTHLAGSSAGAIAVASFASQVPPEQALEASARVCDECRSRFGGKAVGNLLPLLREEMQRILPQDAHEAVNEREGVVALAHRELFPRNRPVLETTFETRDHLIEAVCDSCMFPFFSTPFPARIRPGSNGIPKVVVDGFFTVPRERYGCPDFAHLNYGATNNTSNSSNNPSIIATDSTTNDAKKHKTPIIDRTITVACFPHETVGLTASLPHDQIGPAPDSDDPVGQLTTLFRYATQPASREESIELYERGWADAERWSKEESLREKECYLNLLDKQRKEETLIGSQLF